MLMFSWPIAGLRIAVINYVLLRTRLFEWKVLRGVIIF